MNARIGGRAVTVRGGVDSDTQRSDRATLARERGVKGTQPNVQFSAPAPQYDSKWEEQYANVWYYAQVDGQPLGKPTFS